MLSRDAKAYVDTFQCYSEMFNFAWLASFRRRNADKCGFSIQRTNNLPHALALILRQGEILPSRFKDLLRLRVTCRVSGRRIENGERVADWEVSGLDTPPLINMPPIDQWNYVLPEGVPGDEIKPADGGTAFSKNSNVVKIAGFVCGIALDPADAVNEKGNVSSGYLKMLVAQKADFDKGIAVRIYGELAEAQADKLRPGGPVMIADAEFRIRIMEPGKPVHSYPYVQTRVLKLAGHNVIMGETPQWADDLAKLGRANRSALSVQVPAPAPKCADECRGDRCGCTHAVTGAG